VNETTPLGPARRSGIQAYVLDSLRVLDKLDLSHITHRNDGDVSFVTVVATYKVPHSTEIRPDEKVI
jgi:hypothetical protein